MALNEDQGSIEKRRSAVFWEQSRALDRLSQGKIVLLLRGFSLALELQNRESEVRLSKPTGDPRDIPTVALVVDGKRRLSAFEFTAPDGQRFFRLRQGYDDPNPESGAAYIDDEGSAIFSGEYGSQESLKAASELLKRAVDGKAVFNGGVSDISFREGLLHRLIKGSASPQESPYQVLYRHRKPRQFLRK